MTSENVETIDCADVQAIVRIVSDASVVSREPFEWRKVLTDGVSRLSSADAWVWVMCGRNYLGDLPGCTVYQKGGFTQGQFSQLMGNYPFMEKMCSEATEGVGPGRVVTNLCQDLDASWADGGSDSRAIWENVGLEPRLLSFRPPDANGVMNGLVLFRQVGRELFDRREKSLVHAVLSGVIWFDGTTEPHVGDSQALDISPRLNSVLHLLLQGQGRKQIAAELGISINTLGGYIKELYQRFDAHSQAELIRRIVDGGNASPPN